MIEALYIHIPFCVSRCAYCDFATSACNDEAALDAYVDALSLQIRRASKAGLLGNVKTIYLGGGTPTHLGARRLNSLVYLISLSVNLENVDEFTVECNPESLDARMVKDLFALGVDRFSIGVQSFQAEELAAYGRAHTSSQAFAAIQAVQERCSNVSIDLICGGPGQTLKSWRRNLEQAVDAGITHISIYPLTVEEGTPLHKLVEAEEWEGPSEDFEAEAMLTAQEVLEAAGFQRYEVASYAKPGFESKHNTAYWTGKPYLGLGVGAASMLGPDEYTACLEAGLFGTVEPMEDAQLDVSAPRIRLQSCADSAAYSESMGCPAAQGESLARREMLLEDAMLAFRRSYGLSAESFQSLCAEIPELADTMRRLQEQGLVEVVCEGRQVPTELGWLMGNEVFGAIWSLA